ncbi:MAG: AAA family ATPase [Erysipelotrichaceae bacterium]
MIVRIKRIKLSNIKNVNFGVIEFKNYFSEDGYYCSDVVGIYGQNGSGKTACLDALNIISLLWRQQDINSYVSDLLQKDTSESTIDLELSLDGSLATYQVGLSNVNNVVQINHEQLTLDEKLLVKYQSNGNKLLHGSWLEDNDIKQSALEQLIDINSSKSYLFTSDFLALIDNNIMRVLCDYANNQLLVDSLLKDEKHQYLELFSFNQQKLNILEPSLIKNPDLKQVNKEIAKFNDVLNNIIPNLNIDLRILSSDSEFSKVELISLREGVVVSLKSESEGIKKLISLVDSLILLYSNPSVCLVIDEFDAGIFEYLVGELLQLVQQRAQGQLIFTSHNLRALEVLNKDSIVFTTTNPNNRYLRLSSDDHEDLRKLYYRSINLGGQEEELYNKTSAYKIARALKNAGSNNGK